MRKLLSMLLVAAFAMTLANTAAMADVKKGQKYYLKIFKKKLGMNGTKFAALHTVAEWNELFANDTAGFIKEMTAINPKISKFLNGKKWKSKYAPHIKDFVTEYANDTGNVPSCG
jgi:hypothetical protein